MEITKKVRNSNIDFLKFICAFGVICIHTQSSTFQAGLIGDFFSPLCVPFFLQTALVFFIYGLKKIDLTAIANKIWVRIIIPYLFWTLIYFSLIMVKHHLANQNSSIEWWRIFFYGGGAVQLYYIPKMLIMQAFALGVILILNQDYSRKWIGFVFFSVSFGWLFFGIKNNCLGFNEADYGAICIYLIFAFSIAKLKEAKLLDHRYFIFGAALFILLLILKYGLLIYINTSFFTKYLIYINYFISIIGGLSLALLSFAMPSIPFSKRAVIIFGYSYGIYLSHVLFLEAFEFILKYLRVNLFYDFWVKLIFSMCVLCSSILFVFYIKKIQLFKKILIGD